MDVRDVLVDGIGQLYDWLDEAIAPMSKDHLNWLPEGKTVSAGFDAWHIIRTSDNIANFVFRKQMPIWVTNNYFEKMNLPKVDQGTGMGLEDARAVTINDPALLRQYLAEVRDSTLDLVKNIDEAELAEVQMIKPLGEMPRSRVIRQVVMTHGFMHLGEINLIKGMMGMQFSI